MRTDVIVIGGGPGGYVAAIKAAQFGKKVTLVEKADLGGICLNWGCIPTKTLLRSAEIRELIGKSAKFGIEIDPEHVKIDYAKVIEQSRNVAARLSKGVAFLMDKNKVEVISGTGMLLGKNRVEVSLNQGGKRVLEADYIILSTGARSREFSHMKIDGERIITSHHALSMTTLPKSIAIVGAGAIGIEFAYFFRAMGVEVTILEMLPKILPQEDHEISKELEKAFKKKKIKILTGARIEKIDTDSQKATLTFMRKDKQHFLEVDRVLVAAGVQANSENLGLESLNIATEKGWIKVNEFCQTNVPNIYAIGDVNGAPWLAHVASAEGVVAAKHLAQQTPTPINYKAIPGCTYCHPQVASVGYTEQQAIDAGYQVKIGHFPMRANGKALAMGEDEGMVKIIINEKYGEILGCHIIGPEATEMITEIGLAINLEATYQEILHTVHPHPTLTEAIAEATWDASGHSLHT